MMDSVCGFRPLSWGLFFNFHDVILLGILGDVFVPFLGDFFSITLNGLNADTLKVFVPFLGDFFSMTYRT